MRRGERTRVVAVDHCIGDGLRIDGGVDVGIERDGEATAQACYSAGITWTCPGSVCSTDSDGLVHFAVAKGRREFDGAGLDGACGLAGQHIGKRRRAACVEIVSWAA